MEAEVLLGCVAGCAVVTCGAHAGEGGGGGGEAVNTAGAAAGRVLSWVAGCAEAYSVATLPSWVMLHRMLVALGHETSLIACHAVAATLRACSDTVTGAVGLVDEWQACVGRVDAWAVSPYVRTSGTAFRADASRFRVLQPMAHGGDHDGSDDGSVFGSLSAVGRESGVGLVLRRVLLTFAEGMAGVARLRAMALTLAAAVDDFAAAAASLPLEIAPIPTPRPVALVGHLLSTPLAKLYGGQGEAPACADVDPRHGPVDGMVAACHGRHDVGGTSVSITPVQSRRDGDPTGPLVLPILLATAAPQVEAGGWHAQLGTVRDADVGSEGRGAVEEEGIQGEDDALLAWQSVGVLPSDLQSPALHAVAAMFPTIVAAAAAGRVPAPAGMAGAAPSPYHCRLRLMAAMRRRDFPAALDALHAMLDLAYGTTIVGGSGVTGQSTPLHALTAVTAPSLYGEWGAVRELLLSSITGPPVGGSSLGRSLQPYRPLYLACLHLYFGHSQTARTALLEAQRLSQACGDVVVVALVSNLLDVVEGEVIHLLTPFPHPPPHASAAAMSLYESASRLGLWRHQAAAAGHLVARGAGGWGQVAGPVRDAPSLDPHVSYRLGGWAMGACLAAPPAFFIGGGVARCQASGRGGGSALPPGSIPPVSTAHTHTPASARATDPPPVSLLARRSGHPSLPPTSASCLTPAATLMTSGVAMLPGFARHHAAMLESPFIATNSVTAAHTAAAQRRLKLLAEAKRQPGATVAPGPASIAADIWAGTGVALPTSHSAALWSTPLPMSPTQVAQTASTGHVTNAAAWALAGLPHSMHVALLCSHTMSRAASAAPDLHGLVAHLCSNAHAVAVGEGDRGALAHASHHLPTLRSVAVACATALTALATALRTISSSLGALSATTAARAARASRRAAVIAPSAATWEEVAHSCGLTLPLVPAVADVDVHGVKAVVDAHVEVGGSDAMTRVAEVAWASAARAGRAVKLAHLPQVSALAPEAVQDAMADEQMRAAVIRCKRAAEMGLAVARMGSGFMAGGGIDPGLHGGDDEDDITVAGGADTPAAVMHTLHAATHDLQQRLPAWWVVLSPADAGLTL